MASSERSLDVEEMEVDRVELGKGENIANDSAKIDVADASIAQLSDFSKQSIITSSRGEEIRPQQIAAVSKDGEISSKQMNVVSSAEEYSASNLATTTSRTSPMETLIDVNVESGEISVLKHSRLLESEAGMNDLERKMPVESKTDVAHQDAVNRNQGIFTMYSYILYIFSYIHIYYVYFCIFSVVFTLCCSVSTYKWLQLFITANIFSSDVRHWYHGISLFNLFFTSGGGGGYLSTVRGTGTCHF